mgnify:FL=1|jgi:Na+-translocating ferredoxin:NAD+ oxidoreductase RnfG subunit
MNAKNKKILKIAGIIAAVITVIVLMLVKQKKKVEDTKKWIAAIKQVLNDNFEIRDNVIERKRTESEALQAYEKDAYLLNAFNVINSEVKGAKWSSVASLEEIAQRHLDFMLNSKGFVFKLAFKIF